MSDQLAFDDEMAARLDVLYRRRDMVRRRQLVRSALAPAPGERILDVGCGPGFYVAELLEEMGPDGAVVGIDASPQMLAAAGRRCATRSNVSFHEGDATALPVDDESFDAAFSVQVLEYVPDISAALGELHRVVRPGGRVLVWDVDWSTVSWHSADPDRMARVLHAWDAHLTHRALPRMLACELRSAGFDNVGATGHAFVATEYSADAFAGAIMPLIMDYVSGKGGAAAGDVDAWAAEQRDLGERGEFFFAAIQFCFTASRP